MAFAETTGQHAVRLGKELYFASFGPLHHKHHSNTPSPIHTRTVLQQRKRHHLPKSKSSTLLSPPRFGHAVASRRRKQASKWDTPSASGFRLGNGRVEVRIDSNPRRRTFRASKPDPVFQRESHVQAVISRVRRRSQSRKDDYSYYPEEPTSSESDPAIQESDFHDAIEGGGSRQAAYEAFYHQVVQGGKRYSSKVIEAEMLLHR